MLRSVILTLVLPCYTNPGTDRDDHKGKWEKDKVILFMPDVFGPRLHNAQLFINLALACRLFCKWFPNHTQDKTRPTFDKVLEALGAEGVTAFVATGYYLSGHYMLDLTFENNIKVAAVSYPSLLKVPDDLEKYFASSKVPLLINSSSVDSQFPVDHLLQPTRSSEVASSHQDTREGTLKGVHTGSFSVLI